MERAITPDFVTLAEDEKLTLDRYAYLRQPNRKPEEIKASFDTWADNYNKDTALLQHDDIQDQVVTKMAALCPSPGNAKVLDMGGGTGRMARLMKQHGYTDIDGLDPSAKMLAVGVANKIYNNAIEAFLGSDRLSIEDEAYDLLISMGAFFSSHADPSCFPELIRITKPGGKIAIVWHYWDLYPEYAKAFRDGVREMESQNLWKQVDEVVYNGDDPNGRGGILNVFQKC